jgi:hypothetical protein
VRTAPVSDAAADPCAVSGPPRRGHGRRERGHHPRTTLSRSISVSGARDHTIGRADREAGFGRAAERRWQSTWRHRVQAAPGAPRGLKPLGRRAGRRKARLPSMGQSECSAGCTTAGGSSRQIAASPATFRNPSPLPWLPPFCRVSQRSEPKAPSTPRQALSQLAAPYRYRISLDAEGWPVIPGKLGRLEWHDGHALAVYSGRPRVFARLSAVPASAAGRSGIRRCGGWSRWRASRRWPGSFRLGSGAS